jgi:hypothetical protein
MDQKLLNALNNLSEGLEAIADALKDKKGGNKSATTDALQGGNFTTHIKEINVGVKQLIKDSKQILKNQETIISLSKKSSGDKKSDFEKAGGDQKQESNIKKGVGTILLIAVAVLAIGMAFKLVGGINFLSVVGLSIAILLLAKAFEKVSAMRMSLKEAAIVSASLVLMAIALTVSSWILKKLTPIGFTQAITMIMIGVGFSLLSPAIGKIITAFKNMSWNQVAKAAVGLVIVLPAIALGITMSSWILKKITPIGFTQALTMILIGVGFSVLSPAIGKIIKAFKNMSWGQVAKAAVGLVLVLPAIAVGITLSSWILKKITPISFTQALTAILIAAMFTVLSFGIKKLLKAFGGSGMGAMAKAVLFLPLVLPAIALGIVLSSYVLKRTESVGLKQAWSAIMIALIFTVISFGLKKIINAMDALNNPAAIVLIPLILPAMAVAIWLSSMALAKVQMMSLGQFVVSLGISILFIVFAFALKIMSPVIKKLKASDVIMIPLLMTTLSIAVWASSHILKKTADISFMLMLKILVFSVVFAIAVIVLATVAWVIGKYFGVTNVLKGSVAIVALAAVVMASSLLVSKGDYKKYPSWKWSLFTGLSLAVFGVIAWGLMKLGGVSTYIKGGIALLIVAGTIMAASHIVNLGNYKNYPKLGWTIGVGASLVAFGIAMGVLGLIVTSGVGMAVLAAGALGVLAVAATIVATSHVLAKGKYGEGKYPSLGWSTSVALSLAAFGGGMVLLGGLIIASFGIGGLMLAAGSKAVLKVAETIVKASHILAGGKWKKGPTVEWASGVAIALGAFMPIYQMLMNNGIMKIFGGGGVGPNDFAKAIVTVTKGIMTAAHEFASPKNKGVWKKAPTKEWATNVGLALNAFAPIYKMLMANGIMKLFGGGGVGPNDFAKAIVTVSKGIMTAAEEFASPKNKGVWKKAPTKEWAQGVGLALNAFMPVYAMLMNNANMKAFTGKGGVGPEAFSKAVVTVSKGIIAAAKEFAKNTAPFKDGMYPSVKWGQGVGAALNAFAPLFKALHEDTGFFNSGQDVIDNMVNGIVSIAGAIVRVAKKFSDPSISWKSYPDKNWATHIKMTALRYLWAVNKVNEQGIDYIALSVFDSLVDRLARTARIMGKNQQYFNAKINPNFMKSISSNLFYYMAVAEKLKSKQGIGSMLKGALMGDPITNIANGMLQLAKAYDKLAISLSKLGKSMNGINDKKIAQMERMSRMAKGQNKGMLGSIGDAVGNVAGAAGGLVSGALNMVTPSSGGPGSKGGLKEKVKVGKYGDIHRQNDMIIDLLMELNGKIGAGSNIDTAMLKKINEKKDSKLQ